MADEEKKMVNVRNTTSMHVAKTGTPLGSFAPGETKLVPEDAAKQFIDPAGDFLEIVEEAGVYRSSRRKLHEIVNSPVPEGGKE